MNKLELKHLAPYLPYGLKIKMIGAIKPMEIDNNIDTVSIDIVLDFEKCKPILRPLSDLTEELDWLAVSTVKFLVDSSKLPHNSNDLLIEGLMYSDVIKLLENHFDVFGLIEKGLAIDINTIDND